MERCCPGFEIFFCVGFLGLCFWPQLRCDRHSFIYICICVSLYICICLVSIYCILFCASFLYWPSLLNCAATATPWRHLGFVSAWYTPAVRRPWLSLPSAHYWKFCVLYKGWNTLWAHATSQMTADRLYFCWYISKHPSNGRHQWKKGVFFRALLESPKPPPPDPNSGNLVLFFRTSKGLQKCGEGREIY